MIDSLIYSIPASIVGAYRGRALIVRSDNPAKIRENIATQDLERINYLQLLTPGADLSPLMHWGETVPIDLVVQAPEEDFPRLYQWSQLLGTHPVRVTVPVVPGFSKVVKLAISLNFAVKLDVCQPSPPLVEEMLLMLHTYLHKTTVAQPIEFFHSLFLSFYRKEPLTLWAIQDEDPAYVRYVSENGEETLARRFTGPKPRGDIASFVHNLKNELEKEGTGCSCCRYFERCVGYFRFCGSEYRCKDLIAVFETLEQAALQLQEDLASLLSGAQEEC